ncbi:hypothetical protein ABZ471_32490 [Streptomyces sp. NPDC005728]|uniref:hypothetical protein n=1 Tax=Streptomyces sp. NPDC005728 TaxID=3157054 RepID=UPI003410877F
MGERHSGDGSGRRRAHPGGTTLGPAPAGGDAEFELRFAAALRRDATADGIDSEAEQRAVAAFRAVRDSGAHRTHTRRRDDWRPLPSRTRLSLKTTLSVFLASATLGGVAYAEIGSAGSGADAGDRQRVHPSASAPERSATEPTAPASTAPSARPDRPDTAKDTLAHCRAYEHVKGRGKALDSTAWQRLVTAAGGEEKVAAYCAAQLARTNGANGVNGAKDAKDAKDADGSNGSTEDKGDKSDNGGSTDKKAADPEKVGGKK